MRSLILTALLLATPAAAQTWGDQLALTGYSASDAAAYVTDSRNPDVLNYVVCLAEAVSKTPSAVDLASTLKLAEATCKELGDQLVSSPDGYDAQEIMVNIMECGFASDGEPDDMGCE